MQTESNTVLNISLHALEDLSGDLDGKDDGAETRGEEDDIGGGLGGFGSTFDGNTAVGLLQGGSVVDTWREVRKQTRRCVARWSLPSPVMAVK